MRLLTKKEQKQAFFVMTGILRACYNYSPKTLLSRIELMDTIIDGIADLAFIVGGVNMIVDIGRAAGMLDENGRCKITKEENCENS